MSNDSCERRYDFNRIQLQSMPATNPGKPVFVGYPAGFDFLFVYWYLIRFTGESPFSFSALDGDFKFLSKPGSNERVRHQHYNAQRALYAVSSLRPGNESRSTTRPSS